jgi:flagellar basal-body rod modification protein FlgD
MPTDVSLPPSILTAQQYEEQQMAARYSTESELGRDAFLKLFTTQLTNQNPLEPMDNEAFVSQLAQFSALESMKAMQASMDQVALSINSGKFVAGSNLLGRLVENNYGIVTAGGGEMGKASVTLDTPAEELIIRAYDVEGNEVYTRNFGRQTPGEVQIDWAGEDNNGDALPYGPYKLVVSALLGGMSRYLKVNALEKISAVHWDSEIQEYSVETESGRILSAQEITSLQI